MTNLIFQGGNSFNERIANAKVDVVQHLWDQTVLTNFGPRFAFAWDPTQKGNMSIRGGLGVFFDRVSDNIFLNSALNPPIIARATASIFTPAFTPVFALGTTSEKPYGYPLPPGIVLGLNDKNAPAFGGSVSLLVTEPNFKAQYGQNWFFGLQYAFTENWVVEADYIGSVGRHLYDSPDVNRFNGDLIQNNGVLTRLNSSFGVIGYGQSRLNSAYHGATFSLTKRYSRGLALTTAFTIGKALDQGSHPIAVGNNPTPVADVNNVSRERGLANFDIRRKLAVTALWRIPAPKFSSGFFTKLFDGWQVTGVTILQSGPPFSVTCSRPFIPVRSGGVIVGNNGCDYNADGFNYDYPNTPTFGNSLQGLERSDYLKGLFKASDFPAPPLGQQGNLGRNTFFGPGFANTDIGILKNTKVRSPGLLAVKAQIFRSARSSSTPSIGSICQG